MPSTFVNGQQLVIASYFKNNQYNTQDDLFQYGQNSYSGYFYDASYHY